MTYPIVEPFDQGVLEVSDGHRIYWERVGDPHGKPAVVLHGGPGSGATPGWRSYFDPDRYQVTLFDQRGCGRSRPLASDADIDLSLITTQHLLSDIEALRALHGIDRWLVFGGSWGSTLGLAYAVEHPSRVSELVCWGVTTTTRHEVDWLTWSMGEIYPEAFAELCALVPELAWGDNIAAAYHRLLMDSELEVRARAAYAWCAWEERPHIAYESESRWPIVIWHGCRCLWMQVNGPRSASPVAVKSNTRMQPKLNTAVERVDLFNLHPRVAINLHCIPTAVVEMQPKFIKRPP